MATTIAQTAPGFAIHKLETTEKPGRYDAEVAALAEAGPGNSIDIQVPTTETSDRGRYAGQEVDAVPKYIRYFQYSAGKYRSDDNPNGFTARVERQDDQGDGSTIVEFSLHPKQTRKPKNTDSSDVPEES